MWQHGGGTDGAPDAAGNGRNERTLQGYSRQSIVPCRRGNHADTPHVQSEEERRSATRTLHTRKGNPQGYSVGIDLGEKVAKAITEIRFAPSTDLNFVEKGHLYELYYFDTDWHLLKRVYSQGTSLTFHDVSKNALLLLKDRTGGREERIFTYENGKVRWW